MEYENKNQLIQAISEIVHEDATSETVSSITKVFDESRSVYEITEQELLHLKGVGIKRTRALMAAIKLSKIITRKKVIGASAPMNSPEIIADLLMEEMRHLDREQFRILLLDTKNRIISDEIISIGSLNSSIVHPREVFKSAVKRSAASIIAIHNHPTGSAEPSKNDIDITKRLVEAGVLLGIPVLDHIIIGDRCFVSFEARGLI